MSSLGAFFDAQARFFAEAATPRAAAAALVAVHPGWTERPERVAIYAEFALGHVQTLLAQLYRVTRAAVPQATWDLLVARYYDLRPARASYEINAAGAGFPAFLVGVRDELALPAFVPTLAAFEWALYQVHGSPVEVPAAVERLCLNPDLLTYPRARPRCGP